MVGAFKLETRRPGTVALRSQIVEALSTFIAERQRAEWTEGFSSSDFHLVIDDKYGVVITNRPAPTTGLCRFSVPLVVLNLDLWAVGLGGTVKEVALEIVADAVVRIIDRPEWWVP